MGKSSLSFYTKYLLEKKYNMIVLYIPNDGINDIETLITSIIETLLEEIETESWAKELFNKFKDNIETVGFLSLNVKFRTKEKKELNNLVKHFAEFLKELSRYFEGKKQGLIIIIDDVNGLSESEVFPNWYKSFATKLDSYYNENIPIGFILTSYPQNFNKLKELNPSFTRIFNKIDLNRLNNNEVKIFFENIFKKSNMTYDKKAMELIVKYSYGMPLMMQEIGYNIFWLCDNDKYVSAKIALDGIKLAGNSILNNRVLEK